MGVLLEYMRIDSAVGLRAHNDEAASLIGFLPSPVFEFVYPSKATAPMGHVAKAHFFELEGEVGRKRNQNKPHQNTEYKEQTKP